MRIISGKFKGKTIDFLKSTTTRPLKDSVKESIFNVIAHSNLLNVRLEGSNILDLYSGIGSFGLECISRGAKKITFVEKDLEAVKILNINLINLSIEHQALIVTNKISNFLETNQDSKFEIIFLDPPFAENDCIQDLKLIYKKKIYADNHLIVLHRERRTSDNYGNIFKPLITKEFGRSKIIFGNFLD